jgi:hypothetical protein
MMCKYVVEKYEYFGMAWKRNTNQTHPEAKIIFWRRQYCKPTWTWRGKITILFSMDGGHVVDAVL